MGRKRTFQEVINLFKSEGYTVTLKEEEYAGWKNKIPYICNEGHQWSTYPGDFMRGIRCAKCRGLAPFSYEEVRDYLERYGYSLLSTEYVNSHSDLYVKCNYGHKYHTTFDGFKNAEHRCRKCSSSKGANTTRFILHSILPKNIKVVEEYPIKHKGINQRFDFFIPYKNGIFIEFDGEGHTRIVDFWGGEEGFKKRQMYDENKNSYVKHVKGSLLRIPHTASSLEIYNIIFDFLKPVFKLNTLSPNELIKSENYTKYEFTIEDVVNFYKNHTMKETTDNFDIDSSTVHRYFRGIYGEGKKAWIKKNIKEEMAKYYLTHSNKETQKKFNLSDLTVQKYFKEVYGTDKTSYLKGYTKMDVVNFYLTHSASETANHFGIFKTTPQKYFKEIHGMNKTDYINKMNGTNYPANQVINKIL